MNSSNAPYVHVFNTARNDYLYDVNTNLIVKVSRKSSEHLHNRLEYTDELIELHNAGVLKANPMGPIRHPLDAQIEHLLQTKVNRIVLQLTQQCNLRCNYCVYSENYTGTRMHSSKQMSSYTLRKSIDFLASHSSQSDNLHIGFYGGEPLLRFDLIQEAFSYIKEKLTEKRISYSMTTNGVLLSGDVLKTMVENDVAIQVSFDGPEEIHDRNRRNIYGTGSFQKVIANLEQIYNSYPEYYSKNISFNAVVDGACTCDDILPFFTTHHLFRDNFVKISGLNNTIPNSMNPHTENKNARKLAFRKYATLYFFKSLTDENYNPNQTLQKMFSFWMVEGGLLKQPSPLHEEHIHSGLCIPGVSRLFISADGTFHICEKVSELCDGPTSIGNLESGFDLSKVRNLMNLYNASTDGCSSCWAIHLCRVCAAMVKLNDNCWHQSLEEYCVISKKALERQLIDYCTFHELKKLYSNR